MFLGLLVIIKH